MKNFEDVVDLIERADRLIRLKATGTFYEFAATLHISRASVFRLLQYVRAMGAPVQYCKYRKTYYYQYPIKIEITFRVICLERID